MKRSSTLQACTKLSSHIAKVFGWIPICLKGIEYETI